MEKVAASRRCAFTLIEMLVVVSIIGILASLLLPSLARGKARGRQLFCANNIRQLALACAAYAHENDDRLPYNLGATEIARMLREGGNYNWAGSLMNWELDAENTNLLLNIDAGLGQYVARSARVFRCPNDSVLSEVQREAGWRERSRSISMNAMIGDAGEFTRTGTNVNNPSYRQYLKASQVGSPSEIFVFIEEHPDSINDGYFLNKAYYWEWLDLPASYHTGGANLSYADGHVEPRKWVNSLTRRPAKPDAAQLPINLNRDDRQDFEWLIRRMSAR